MRCAVAATAFAPTQGEAEAEPMTEMSEDDILAALQSLEASAPKDRGDGRGGASD